MKGMHGILAPLAALMLVAHTHATPQKSYSVCLPHKQEPCASYRITTQDDVINNCAFSFDPRELGCQDQEQCTRCWFKINAAHRKAMYNLIKGLPEKTRIKDMIADLEKNIPAGIESDDHHQALLIIKEIVDLSGGEAQAWHFTAWLAYERPLALKK